MTLTPNNVLTDPLFRIQQGRQHQVVGLTEILAMSGRAESFSLTALRTHQQHPWHTFLCQLAAMALAGSEHHSMPTDSDSWLQLIRQLTPDHAWPTAWNLFEDDITKPAFLQPPAPHANSISDYRYSFTTPDEADVIKPASNHEVKRLIATDAEPDDWILALISLQTSTGFDAPRTYGTSRMNGGLGNRPCVALVPASQPYSAVRRDVHAILEASKTRPSLLPTNDQLITLLWIPTWDGSKGSGIPLSDLHPLFIEICRRIRLQADTEGHIKVIRGTTTERRVTDSGEKGFLTDPWSPMDIANSTTHTPGQHGTTCRQLAEFLTTPEKWKPPLLLQPTKAELANTDQPMSVMMRNITRGQGKTAGYHERTYVLGPATLESLFTEPPAAHAVETVVARTKAIQAVRRNLLNALQMGQYRAEAKVQDYKNSSSQARALPWTNQFEELIWSSFFQYLELELAAPDQERSAIRTTWIQEHVAATAQSVLNNAFERIGPPSRSSIHGHQRAQEFLQRRTARIS